jgi:hypothetical protein
LPRLIFETKLGLEAFLSRILQIVSIACGLLVFCFAAHAQPLGRPICNGIDVTKAENVFSCVSSLPNKSAFFNSNFECSEFQGSWRNLTFGPGGDSAARVPTCPVIAEVIRLATGKKPIWTKCMVQRQGVAGTEAHIRDCLNEFFPGANGGRPPWTLDSCTQIYDHYDQGLAYATPIVLPEARRQLVTAPRIENGIPQEPLPRTRPRLGPSPFDDPAVVEHWTSNPDRPHLKKRDCGTAARVATAFAGGRTPTWAACLNYDPSQVGRHLQACLGPDAKNLSSCVEGRAAYEAKLKAAYGGSLPANYAPATCDVLNPVFREARVAAQSLAKPPESNRPSNASSQNHSATPKRDGNTNVLWLIGGLIALAAIATWYSLKRDNDLEGFDPDSHQSAGDATTPGRSIAEISDRRRVVSQSGYSAEVFDRYGIVVDTQTWSETHVSGSSTGGGGYLHHGTGFIDTPSISVNSKVVNRNRVFIKFDDGSEEVRNPGEEFPMRAGHRVLYRYLKFKEASTLIFYRNFDTGQEWLKNPIIDFPKSNHFQAPFIWSTIAAFVAIWGAFLSIDRNLTGSRMLEGLMTAGGIALAGGVLVGVVVTAPKLAKLRRREECIAEFTAVLKNAATM